MDKYDELAREFSRKWVEHEFGFKDALSPYTRQVCAENLKEVLEPLLRSVAADERERAVVIAEQYNDPYDANDIGIRIAALIRGEKENDNE